MLIRSYGVRWTDDRRDRAMTFWSNERLRTEGPNLIHPYRFSRISEAAYQLALGPEAYVTSGDVSKKVLLDPGQQLVIPPGQFALLITEERVTIPPDALGLISVKSQFKLHGLVNVSGFHVDPGFSGRLIFSVYNASGKHFAVSRGEELFLLWVAALDQAVPDERLYKGSRRGQETIPNSDIMAIGREQFSPAAMNDRLGKLEAQQRVMLGVLIAILVGVVGYGLQNVLRDAGVGRSEFPAPAESMSDTGS